MEAVSALVPSLPAVPTTAPATAPPSPLPSSPVMEMLHDHVPLTLLLDLALGVRSAEVYEDEIADLSWLPVVVPRAG